MRMWSSIKLYQPDMMNVEERDEEMLGLYAKYLLMPLAYDVEESEIYNRDFVVITGFSFGPPRPHRHYTLEEFKDKIASDETFKRFCSSLMLPK